MNNNIILECNKEITNTQVVDKFEKVLLQFYLSHGTCHKGTLEESKISSRYIVIKNDNLQFHKINNNGNDDHVKISKDIISIISKYTPYVSYKHYELLKYYLGKLYILNNNNKNRNTEVNRKSLNDSNIYLPNNTKLSLNKNSFVEILIKIKDINVFETKIKYLLLAILYFYPLTSISLNENFLSTSNKMKSFQNIVNSYITKSDLNENIRTYGIQTLFYIYNSHLVPYYLESYTINKEVLNTYRISNLNKESCNIKKLLSQSNSCILDEINYNNLPENIQMENNEFALFNFIKQKSDKRRKIYFNIIKKNNKINNSLSTIKFIDNDRIKLIIDYDLIKKIANITPYISLNQLITINNVYKLLKFNNTDLEYLIILIVYVYGNSEFKEYVKSEYKFKNLESKKNSGNILKQQNEIVNEVSKIKLYLNQECIINSNKNINTLINEYNNIFSKNKNINKVNKVKENIEYIMKIVKCGLDAKSENIISLNGCLRVSENKCVLNKTSVLNKSLNRVKSVFRYGTKSYY